MWFYSMQWEAVFEGRWFSIELVLMIGFIGGASDVCVFDSLCLDRSAGVDRVFCEMWPVGGVSIWLLNEINRKDVENQNSGRKHQRLCMHTLRHVTLYAVT